MKLEDIHEFFEYPPPTYLCTELAVCYILSVLLQGESYGTELIQKLETECPSYRLSDTVLYSAIKFLEDEQAITGYWKKLEGRGRPRRMYQVAPEWQESSQYLARLWHEYTENLVSRGRPRRMYQVAQEWQESSQDLARLRHEYTDRRDEIVNQKPAIILPDKSEYISYTQVPLVYSIWLSVSSKKVTVGNELVIDIYISLGRVKHSNSYQLEVDNNQAIDNDINFFLIAPGFSIHGDNVSSLNLDENIGHIRQNTSFHLTAVNKGLQSINVEIYIENKFKTNLGITIDVKNTNQAYFIYNRTIFKVRPVPQPDLIIIIRKIIYRGKRETFKLNYQVKSLQLESVLEENKIYESQFLSIKQIKKLIELVLEALNTINNKPNYSETQEYFSIVSLSKELFEAIFPKKIRDIFKNLVPQESTLLILTVRDVSIPWELLHDGQRFFGERFIIGRWLRELSDTRPYEFPVGAINIAHYANVEQPELWANLLQPPGAPPPQLLPEGLLHDSTEAMRGLHLIRYSQPADAANRRDAPARLDSINDTEEDIETKIRPTKLNLRRNRPFVSLSYVKNDISQLQTKLETELEKTWASAFIRAGCSGFTGSLWAVEPSVEAAFISSFYNQLWTGASLGEAFYTSRQLARAVAPDSLDWLAYVLFGDPMARPYLPVEGKGYGVVEPIGRDIDEPMPVGVPLRFRLSLRRTPPVWHEERVMEVAEDLRFENLQVHVNAFGLEVTPDSIINMNLAPTGNYLGWFTLTAPPEIAGNSVLVEVYFMDGEEPIDNLIFSLEIGNEGGEIGE
jgi:DNA-binding PadR family transcriptional regulator